MIITDFGLSKDFGLINDLTDNVETYNKSEIGYVEPQCFINPTYKRDKASDIYSLGVILWEISSGRPPSNMNDSYEIARGKREPSIRVSPYDYVRIYQAAWDNDPRKRPTITKVREDLEILYLHLQENERNMQQLQVPPGNIFIY